MTQNATRATIAAQRASPVSEVVLRRLEEQTTWYDRSSRISQALYKLLKLVTITAAATIPVLTTSPIPHATQIAAALGVTIAVIEGIQQLNQYQISWTSFRATAEALKREKYLYFGKAGLYAKSDDALALLAERVEALVSQENTKWLTTHAEGADTIPTGKPDAPQN